MTDQTSDCRADTWFRAADAIERRLPQGPACERLFRGAFNCAEIAVDLSTFRNGFNGLDRSFAECMETQLSESGLSPSMMIRQCQRMGGDLMLTLDGFVGHPYHESRPDDPFYAPFPGDGLFYYRRVAEWLARNYKPRYMVVLNEPSPYPEGGIVGVDGARYCEIVREAAKSIRRGSPETTIIASGHLNQWMFASDMPRGIVAEWHSWEFELSCPMTLGETGVFSFLGHTSPNPSSAARRFELAIREMRDGYHPSREHFLGEIAPLGHLPGGTTRDDAPDYVSAILGTLEEERMGYSNLVLWGDDRPVDKGKPVAALVTRDGLTLGGAAFETFAKSHGYWTESTEQEANMMDEHEVLAVLELLVDAESKFPSIRRISKPTAQRREGRARTLVGKAIERLEAAVGGAQ